MEKGSSKERNTQRYEANRWVEKLSIRRSESAIVMGPYEIVESGRLLDSVHPSETVYKTASNSEELAKIK